MSFFFANAKREAKTKVTTNLRRSPQKVSAKTKQSADTLNRLGCAACPLAKQSDRVHPNIPKKRTEVLFLSEAPGPRDEEKGKPLYGAAGKLLKDLIPDEHERNVGYATIVQHRPPDDKEPDWVEVECCRGHTTKAIEEARPRLIVGLGIGVLRWALANGDMIGMRGRVFSIKIGEHKCFFMPTFDPKFVREKAYDDERPLQSRVGHAFRMDIQKAFDLLDTDEKPVVVTVVEAKKDINIYNGQKSSKLGFKELMEEFKKAMKAKTWALDFETYPLRPYAKDAAAITASISLYKEDGVHTFAFAIDHPKAGWTKNERAEVLAAFKKLAMNRKATKIAHNQSFELEWLLFLFGTDIVDHYGWEDTMMMAHIIDERKGPGKEEDRRPTYQSLDFLCKQYLGLKLKAMFNLDKKDMRKSDLDTCLLYNGCDSKFTLILHEVQLGIIKREKLLKVHQISKPRQTTVALMQHFGISVDSKVTMKFQKRLDREVKGIEAEISELKIVKQFEKDKRVKFNPHSGPELITILRDYLKRTEINVAGKRAGDADRIAVDKGVLDRIEHPIAGLIIKLRNKQKLKSTYVDPFVPGEGKLIYPDGMLHTNFNTTFTTTVRLSSDDPNMQNFPKREDKWVRAQIAAPKGYSLVSFDFGQLEWCLACICCKDKVMVDATWTGYDVHMEWAVKIAKLWPKLVGGKKHLKNRDTDESKKKYKYARGLVKNKMVFPVIFGATQDSVRGYLDMPEDVAGKIFKEFWNTFGGLAGWQKKVMKDYYDKGYVENLFGRRRRYPLSKNEAINSPIQSTAADIVIDAMDRLSIMACETKQWHLHPRLNIHDDLSFIIPDELLDEASEIIVKEMLTLPFDFINVPMSVEMGLGSDWSNQEDIGKFWTHDISRTDPKTRSSTRID